MRSAGGSVGRVVTEVQQESGGRAGGLTLTSLFEAWQLSTHLDPDALMRQVVPKIAQATRADRVSLMLLEEESQALTVSAAVGLAPEAIGAHVGMGQPIAGWVALKGQALLLPNGSEPPAPIQRAMKRPEITSALSVPLRSDGRVMGVLNVGRLNGHPFTPQDLRFTSMLGERIGPCVETARLYADLEERHALSAAIVDELPAGLLVVDGALRVVSANQCFLRMTRRDASLTIGHALGTVLPGARQSDLGGRVREALGQGRQVDGGKLIHRAPGLPTRVYACRIHPLDARRGRERATVLLEDITEREHVAEQRERAERHLATIVDRAEDLVLSLTPSGRVVTWNRAAEAITRLTSHEAIGKLLPRLCVGPHQNAMADLLRHVARGTAAQRVDLPLRTREGTAVPISWSVAPMRNDHGRTVGIVALGRDLTERATREARPIGAARLASLGFLAPAIAHELRNPLASAAACAQVLLDRPVEERDRADGLLRIRASIQRAVGIVESLLRIATSSGPWTERVDVNDLLTETRVLVNGRLTSQNVRLTMDLAPELPPVQADPVLLQQVFTNVVFNASAAMDAGGELAVGTSVREGIVRIRFADTGCGIPAEHLDRIFEPFFTTHAPQGTGLGLPISRTIVEQHKGTIEVHSEVGKGTTVIVGLPAAPVAVSTAQLG